MNYELIRHQDIPKKEKFGISLDVYPRIGGSGFVVVETETGHNQEFYDIQSTFSYIVLEGKGSFFLNSQEVPVEKGDFLSVPPKTTIYYKGKMRLALITNPAWKAENEVETRAKIW